MQAVDVRGELADALKLDLVGPSQRLGSPTEILPQAPSRWYLTGFLVPLDADPDQKMDEDSTDAVDALSDAGGADDATTPEPASARQSYMPSSTGLSILIGGTTTKLKIKVRWGDYKIRKPAEGQAAQEEWERRQHEQELTIDIPEKTKNPRETEIRGSGGLKVALSVRQVESDGAEGSLPKNTRCASVFLVNRRTPKCLTKSATKPSLFKLSLK